MTGVIIAGGLGTRLRSLVTDPKCLAPVNGEPFIFRLLTQLVAAGVQRILLCTGYGADQVEQCIGPSFAGVPVLYSREQQPLGTAGALKLAANRYGCQAGQPSCAWSTQESNSAGHAKRQRRALPGCYLGDGWLVMNGDSYLELDIAAFKHSFERSECLAAIAAARVPDGRRFGALECSADWRITGFAEKSDEAGPKWINGGVYLLSSAFLAKMPENVPLSIERDVFPAAIESGLLAYPSAGRFIDIGIPESFAEAQTFFVQEAVL